MNIKSPATLRDTLFVVLAVCLATLLLPLSFSGVAIARPAIGHALGGSPVARTLITNAFMLGFGSTLLGAGTLADTYGRKRAFTLGMAAFSVISLVLAQAASLVWLDALRGLQGVAGALAFSSGIAALMQIFEGQARKRALSLLGTVFAAGLAFGPLLAGVLIDIFDWRAIFLCTAAIGILALLIGVPHLRESTEEYTGQPDWPGTVTFSVALIFLTLAIILAPGMGWASPIVISLLTLFLISSTAFVMIEMLVDRPMLDLTLLSNPQFVGAQVLPIGTWLCYLVLVVLLPLRFIGIERLSATHAGALMLALSMPLLVAPSIVTCLRPRISAGVLSGIGFLIAAVGLYWLSCCDITASIHTVLAPMGLIGLGVGIPRDVMSKLAASTALEEQATAVNTFNTARVAGEGVSIAAVGAVLAAWVHTNLEKILATCCKTTSSHISEAALRISAGDLPHALEALPEVSSNLLIAAYNAAFQSVLLVLAGLAVVFAIVTFTTFSTRKSSELRDLCMTTEDVRNSLK